MAIFEAIKQYLDKEETNYAVMIKGDWGSGKTHFWKNQLSQHISEQSNNNKLYLSFFGIDTTEDILNKIITEIIGQSNKTVKNIISTISKLMKDKVKIDLSIIPNFINFDNYVICIDDIERANIKINQIFGFMNYFIEHQQSKVIFLTNEEDILSKFDKQVDKDKYYKEKEKIIRYTYKLEIDLNEIFNDLISNYEQNYKLFLSDSKPIIIDCFNKSQWKNLRILKNAIDDFMQVYGYYQKNKKKYEHVIPKDLEEMLFFLIASTFINKSHNLQLIDNDYKTLFATLHEKGLKNFYHNLTANIKGTYYGSLIFRVINGYLNISLLEEEFEEIQQIKSEDKTYLNYFNRYWDLSEELFDETVDNVYKLIKDGKIKYCDYPKYFKNFSRLINNGLFNETIKNLLLNFLMGLELSKKNAKYIQFISDNWMFEDKEETEEYYKIRDKVEKINEEMLLKEIKEEFYNLINKLPNEVNQFLTFIQQSYNEFSIFNETNIDLIFRKIIEFNNTDIFSFANTIGKRYKFSKKSLTEDKKALTILVSNIKKYDGDKLKKHALNNLSKRIKSELL